MAAAAASFGDLRYKTSLHGSRSAAALQKILNM